MWTFIAVVVLLLLVIGFIKLFRQTRFLKKIRQHLLNIPAFDNGLIDCYVKVSGRLKSENGFFSPISKKTCAFYIVKVLALWETKKKKPSKGMEQHKKVILKTVSPLTRLEISEGKDIIYVDMGKDIIYVDMAAYKGVALLQAKKVESRNCPAICQQAAKKKYKKYQILESWCSHGDQLVVYGKLVKTSQGLLCVKPTELAAFPSFIGLQQNEKTLLKEIDRKIGTNTNWLRFYLMGIFCAFGLSVFFW